MPEKGKKTLTVDEQTHYEIGVAARQAKRLTYVFVNEVWEFWKAKGKVAPPPAIQFAGPKAEAGFEWIKVPERLAPKFQRLVDLFSQDPKMLRSILDLVESSKSSPRYTVMLMTRESLDVAVLLLDAMIEYCECELRQNAANMHANNSKMTRGTVVFRWLMGDVSNGGET